MSKFKPPVPGETGCDIKYVTGYSIRTRSSTVANLTRLLNRFFEFATARSSGTVAYEFVEIPRLSSEDYTTPIELLAKPASRGSIPSVKQIGLVVESLTELIEGCPNLIWKDLENSTVTPAIIYSPDVTAYLSHLKVKRYLSGLLLEGYICFRINGSLIHAYPFGVVFSEVDAGLQNYIFYDRGFKGQFREFNEKLLEFFNISLEGPSEQNLVTAIQHGKWQTIMYNYKGRKIALGDLSSFLFGHLIPVNEILISSGVEITTIFQVMSRIRTFMTEALDYVVQHLPSNPFSIALNLEKSGTGRYPRQDYVYGLDKTFGEKMEEFSFWFESFVATKTSPPAFLSDEDAINRTFGLAYVKRLVMTDELVNMFRTRLQNALIGSESIDLTDSIVIAYFSTLLKKNQNILEMGENTLRTDFQEYLRTQPEQGTSLSS